jgi:hypothetical protein
MKVILTAFNGLMKSDVMEWPELPPGMELDYPLRQMRHNYFSYHRDDIDPAFPVCDIRATFKHTGKTIELGDGSLALEYELVNVDPKHWNDGGEEERRNFRMATMVELILAKELVKDSKK